MIACSFQLKAPKSAAAGIPSAPARPPQALTCFEFGNVDSCLILWLFVFSLLQAEAASKKAQVLIFWSTFVLALLDLALLDDWLFISAGGFPTCSWQRIGTCTSTTGTCFFWVGQCWLFVSCLIVLVLSLLLEAPATSVKAEVIVVVSQFSKQSWFFCGTYQLFISFQFLIFGFLNFSWRQRSIPKGLNDHQRQDASAHWIGSFLPPGEKIALNWFCTGAKPHEMEENQGRWLRRGGEENIGKHFMTNWCSTVSRCVKMQGVAPPAKKKKVILPKANFNFDILALFQTFSKFLTWHWVAGTTCRTATKVERHSRPPEWLASEPWTASCVMTKRCYFIICHDVHLLISSAWFILFLSFLRTQLKERIVIGGRFELEKAGVDYMRQNCLVINCQMQECLSCI